MGSQGWRVAPSAPYLSLGPAKIENAAHLWSKAALFRPQDWEAELPLEAKEWNCDSKRAGLQTAGWETGLHCLNYLFMSHLNPCHFDLKTCMLWFNHPCPQPPRSKLWLWAWVAEPKHGKSVTEIKIKELLSYGVGHSALDFLMVPAILLVKR